MRIRLICQFIPECGHEKAFFYRWYELRGIWRRWREIWRSIARIRAISLSDPKETRERNVNSSASPWILHWHIKMVTMTVPRREMADSIIRVGQHTTAAPGWKPKINIRTFLAKAPEHQRLLLNGVRMATWYHKSSISSFLHSILFRWRSRVRALTKVTLRSGTCHIAVMLRWYRFSPALYRGRELNLTRSSQSSFPELIMTTSTDDDARARSGALMVYRRFPL